jgi:hydroxylamine reductase
MNMFCYQCQETAKNTGCTVTGVCGKDAETSNAMDLLVYVVKGVSAYAARLEKEVDDRVEDYIMSALFVTITNGNFDEDAIYEKAKEGLELREDLKKQWEKAGSPGAELPEAAVWTPSTDEEMKKKAGDVGVLATENEDVRSLRELIIYGIKGFAAYAHHAMVLGRRNKDIIEFTVRALDATTRSLNADELTGLVLETGDTAVKTMALLDSANTGAYGDPEISEVNLGVRNNPGILVSGHDLRDLEELLEQTEGTGVDVYTHGEMLPAHYYPVFKNYEHFVGNYGNSWWKQNKEFESFNGPIVMTTNCITPVKDSYKDRIFTTGVAGYPGVAHIADRKEGGTKDFSAVLDRAKGSPAPTEIETGTIPGGFAHAQVEKLAGAVVEAVKSGAIKKFVVMAGCDGRQNSRSYFTEVAEKLPEDTVILTAGCAKYRYNKLDLGDIGGIPRVLDAGQCNDSYSLAVTALKLKEAFELEDINDLPIEYDIAWYEQKAVAVLLALLSLGVKNIRLGPTLPAFLSPGVAEVLVDKFNIKPTTEADKDVAEMAG